MKQFIEVEKKINAVLTGKTRETVSGPKPEPFTKQDLFKAVKAEKETFDRVFKLAVETDLIKKQGNGKWIYNGQIE